MRPLLAHMRHHVATLGVPVSAPKRTCSGKPLGAAFDSKRSISLSTREPLRPPRQSEAPAFSRRLLLLPRLRRSCDHRNGDGKGFRNDQRLLAAVVSSGLFGRAPPGAESRRDFSAFIAAISREAAA